MNRIDPSAAPDVFDRLGLTPITGDFVGNVENKECCVLTAYYCDANACQDASECLKKLDDSLDEQSIVADDSGYATGVMEGWDDGIELNVLNVSPDAMAPDVDVIFLGNSDRLYRSTGWLDGYRDGLAARRAVEARRGAIGKSTTVTMSNFCGECDELKDECCCGCDELPDYDAFDIYDEDDDCWDDDEDDMDYLDDCEEDF